MNAAVDSGTSAAKDAANLSRSRNRRPSVGGTDQHGRTVEAVEDLVGGGDVAGQ
ncbi:hypothetical protein AB0D29_33250 [Streptomyces sp. NPDC048424]|uniref:hypothetical protein n=1 Tax=Streptomyces sp. NPDC048424 TaxID=3155265 RepID=UPI00343D66A1